MANAYKNNNDTLMTWDIFQHQEQRMMRSHAGQTQSSKEYAPQEQSPVHHQTGSER